MMPNHQKKGYYYVNLCYSNRKTNFNSKNHWKSYFFIETKASISFIPMRRMCLWCLIIKRKEIIMWIRVCQNRWTNINSKNGRKRCFFHETKAWMSFIRTRRICLWCLITKTKEIILWIHVCPNRRTNINSINGRKRSISYKTKASILLP